MKKKFIKQVNRLICSIVTSAIVTISIIPNGMVNAAVTDEKISVVQDTQAADSIESEEKMYGQNIALGKETKASDIQKAWWMVINADENNFEEKVEELFENGYPTDEEGNLLTDRDRIFLENGQLCYETGKKVYDRRASIPANAVDGVVDDKSWHTNEVDVNKNNPSQWMYVDLGQSYEIGRVILNWQEPAKAYRIEVSDDAVEWTTIYTKYKEFLLYKNLPIYAKARYVRIYCTAPWGSGVGVSLKEFKVYAYKEGEEKKTYELEKEPEIETMSVEGSAATLAMNDITFPMAKLPWYMDESLQMPNQPVESNGWWQSIATQELGNRLVLLPLRTGYSQDGLSVTLTNECWVKDHQMGTLGEATTNLDADFIITPKGMNTQRVYDEVIAYSDYAVKTRLCDADGSVMTNMFIKGSPYLYAEFTNKQDIVVSSGSITGIYNENGEILTKENEELLTDHLGLEITDADNELKTKTSVSQFCFNLPPDTRIKRVANSIEIHFAGEDTYLSVGAMTKREDLKIFYEHGYAFVTETSVTYGFDENTSKVKTNFKVETEVKRQGFSSDTIQCLFPHQYKKSLADLSINLDYVSPRGTMKATIGNTFETEDTFYGMVPQFTVPQGDDYSKELIKEYLAQVEQNTRNEETLMNPDVYWQGKGLHLWALAAMVADETQNYEYRDIFLERMNDIFEDWFTYTGEDDKYYLYYDENWGTIYYKYSGYGANVGINDHHFTYGYLVFAAAILATYDEEFYSKYKNMVDYLVRDYASPYEEDPLFCKFRNFDPYEGHSWADGYAENDNGNNQESASEALFGWVGMYLWAIRSENEEFKEAAIWGFTTELNAVEQYWFNYDGDNWPKDWPHYVAGQVYGAHINYISFFDTHATSLYGIHWLPVAEWITHYGMGDKKEKIQKLYEGFLEEIEQQRLHESEENKPYVKTSLTDWQYIFVPVRSLYDADAALEDYWKVCNGEVTDGDGNTVTMNSSEQFNPYWFALNMKELGFKTDEIYALDGVSASVYKKDDTYTAICFNPLDKDMKVRFTNGKEIVGTAVVPAQSLVRFNPVGGNVIQTKAVEFSVAEGTYEDTQYLTMKSATEGAKIHYTTDGSEPTKDSPLYTTTLPITESVTIKAIAVKEGCLDSEMESVAITIEESCITTGKNIAYAKNATASSKSEDAYYLIDGDANSKWQADTEDNEEWCMIDLGKEYTINKLKLKWEATCAKKYKILVSTDMQDFTEVYAENHGEGNTDEVTFAPIKARYVKILPTERSLPFGVALSEVGVYEARQICEPKFSIADGVYGKGQRLSMASATRTVTIHYTTDGTEPTKDSPVYVPGMILTESAVVKAKAFRNGMIPSETTEAVYTILEDAQIVDESRFAPELEAEVSEEEPGLMNNTEESTDIATVNVNYYDTISAGVSSNEESATNLIKEEGRWQADASEQNPWCYVELNESRKVNLIEVKWDPAYAEYYDIYLTDDIAAWKADAAEAAMSERACENVKGKEGIVESVLKTPQTAKYVVIRQKKASGLADYWGTAIYQVRVGYREPVLVENVKANVLNETMEIGQTQTISYNVSPANADDCKVIFLPSDEAVAKVNSNGVITAKAAGKALITVCAQADATKCATIEISVAGPMKADRPVATITNEREITVTWQGNENALGYNIYRSNGSRLSGFKKQNKQLLRDTKYVDTDLEEGTYYYKVEFIAAGESIYRNSELSMQSYSVCMTNEQPDGEEGDTSESEKENPGSDRGDKEEPSGNEGGDKEETSRNEGGDKEETTGNEGGDKEENKEVLSGNKQETGTENGNNAENNAKQIVSSVKLSAANRPNGVKTLYIKNKSKISLKATVEGVQGVSQAVIYKTSNPKIATVNSKGQVKTGNKTGNVTITAISALDSKKYATIRIKVVKKAVPNKVLKLKQSKLTFYSKGQQSVILLKKYTKKTTEKVIYKVISGKKYVSVDKYGVVKCKKNPGKKTVNAKIRVTCGKKKAILKVAIIHV